MGEFTPINTQDELNKIIGERVARAEEKARSEEAAKYADYAALKEQAAGIEKLKSDHAAALADVQKKYEDLQKENAGYKRADLVRAATKKFGIDYEDSNQFIQGNTAEEITASAEALSKIVGKKGGAPLRSTTAGDNSVGDSIRRMAHELSNR